MAHKKGGWYRESARHGLAAKGIKTGRKNPVKKRKVRLNKANAADIIWRGLKLYDYDWWTRKEVLDFVKQSDMTSENYATLIDETWGFLARDKWMEKAKKYLQAKDDEKFKRLWEGHEKSRAFINEMRQKDFKAADEHLEYESFVQESGSREGWYGGRITVKKTGKTFQWTDWSQGQSRSLTALMEHLRKELGLSPLQSGNFYTNFHLKEWIKKQEPDAPEFCRVVE